ncbi:MAG: saccharopine dehydrogenase [Pseudohongiella sp.]|nr:saccharopine dehydrogenase [Pseudohongiella sp.]MDP2285447.1 saccharopine dehydrogenase [Pseudohongiella sp.]
MKTLWLRREDKAGEWRVALTPDGVNTLVQQGINVVVERSAHRVFSDQEFEAAGANLTDLAWWQAPHDAIILGLKELADADTAIAHTQIYFSHTFKGQSGAGDVLQRYASGGGDLFDLEFLQDDQGRRIAAFGYWAGFVGAALGMLGLAHYQQTDAPFPAAHRFASQQQLIDTVKNALQGQSLRVMVMGALGRCGTGATDLLRQLGPQIDISRWDIAEFNAVEKPIQSITEHDVFVNCVYLREPIRPMINPALLATNQRLKIISDVSCDPNNPNNPIAVYDATTSLDAPFRRADGSDHWPVYVQAIDHLPTLLPREASQEFATALLPHLLEFLTSAELPPVWRNAKNRFVEAKQFYGLSN